MAGSFGEMESQSRRNYLLEMVASGALRICAIRR